MTFHSTPDGEHLASGRRSFSLAMALCASLLASACGGSGEGSQGSAPSTPPAPTPTYSFVGPQDNDLVDFACGNADGEAAQARYPAQGASYPGIQLATLPDGRLLGRVTSDSPYTYFTIDNQGRREPYTARTPDALRVDAEGKLWWVDPNQTLWRGALQDDGRDERIGTASAFNSSPADGRADQVALGNIKSFAARDGVVYLLVQDSSAAHFFLRRLTRNGDGSWQTSSIAVPDGVASAGFDAKVLTNRSGVVALVATSPTQAPPELFNTTYTRSITVTYWQLKGETNWQAMASKSYELTSSNIYSKNTLALESVALAESGDLVWGGGRNANLYAMGQNGSWSVLASPAGVDAAGVGTEGSTQQATFLSAHNVLVAPNGNAVLFYDAVTCQVRKLSSQTLSTVSGPRYATRAHFGNANLLGLDGSGALVFVSNNKWLAHVTARYDTVNGRFTAQEGTGPISAVGGEGCANNGTRGMSCASYLWQLPSMMPAGSLVGYDKGTDATYAIADSNIYRSTSAGYQALGPAPQYSRGGTMHDFPYLIGYTEQFDPILFRFDTSNNSLQAIAGRTVDSPVYAGKRTLLNYSDAQFVQRRSDNGFWLAGTGLVGRITSSGDWTGVAGSTTPVSDLALPIDGQGSGARFANIKRLRVLPDNRLLVLDANAVRLVDDSGMVRTLFTLADTGLAGANWLDMIPIGRDLYLTLYDQPRLMRARNVLP